ncbi:Crp/Fnr family transcriptional regulator [Actinokineospora bangkokensis]|uniref:Cyclic nucleotide-binding domain-containing protein n=1 Tax=Actinokineospora bangkokensis TaxID=1193682 RepID=A0A1Q9LTY2_9PSEU|nr:Crp/Fnr family transcriptional regulator [Actinokineospora bangkokensis]OLR95434.1 hypothetical protein BJP25_06725 [Actinokineospora bangkokensis]
MPTADAGRARLRAAGQPVPFNRGAYLLHTGDPSTHVLLLAVGLAKVFLLTPDGDTAFLGLVGPGELIGEAGVLNNAPRSATIQVLDRVVAHLVPAPAFRHLRATDPDVHALVDATWGAQRRRADHARLTATRDVTTRLHSYLREWATSFGTPSEQGLLVRGISQRDMSTAVAASEKHVETALARLRDRGVVETGRLWYRLRPNP